MKDRHLSAKEWGERIVLALFFTAVGSLIMIVFNPWNPLLDKVADYLGRIGLVSLLLAVTWLVRKSKRFERYWQVWFAFFVLAVAVSLNWVFARYLIDYLGVSDSTPAGWALPKLNECVVVVSVVILFTRLSGSNLGSIYLQRGKLKLGLSIGLIAFFIAAAGSIPMARLFNVRDVSFARILLWTPWLLMHVLANATMEEIMFRGLFLQKLEPFFGKALSNFMIAFVFTVIHGSATYTTDQLLFVAILFPLALAWGYIMQKTEGVWGSILFHAGMDIPIMLGIFSNLP